MVTGPLFAEAVTMEEDETVAGELLLLFMELTTGGGAIEEAATAG